MLKSGPFAVLALAAVTTGMVGLTGCGRGATAVAMPQDETVEAATPKAGPSGPTEADDSTAAESRELVLAGGCFWCLEAGFEQLRGVNDVVSGYAGGSSKSANYRTVSSGLTSHAEAIRITYDPGLISEETLLKVFFVAAHDPTQLNRQGPDVGRQYRSAVFYSNDEQKQRVEQMIADLNASGWFDRKIATTVEPLEQFYAAEDYHQDFAKLNPDQPYVIVHSRPNAARVCKAFPELIREIEGLETPVVDGTSDGKEGHDDTGGAGAAVP